MWLIDHISHTRTPIVVTTGTVGAPIRLPSAMDWADRVMACPVRYVLDDQLTRICDDLAFSDGDRIASCLDLIRFPDVNFWVEWSEIALPPIGSGASPKAALPYRAGVLVNASPDARHATLRTFWSDPKNGEALLAPLETLFDITSSWKSDTHLDSFFDGRVIRLRDEKDPILDALLNCFRYRFDVGWASYYRAQIRDNSTLDQLLRMSMANVARDAPILMGFLLLMNTKDGLPERKVARSTINQKRAKKGRLPLLDHIVVFAPLPMRDSAGSAANSSARRAPRLHRVRGHLVRRNNTVFWRTHHLRGRSSVGKLHTKTLVFSFEGTSASPGVA